jgi:hypothetical protein
MTTALSGKHHDLEADFRISSGTEYSLTSAKLVVIAMVSLKAALLVVHVRIV